MSEPTFRTASRRPVLANSCARAASPAEARYRIATEVSLERSCLLVAMDALSADVVRAARSALSDRVKSFSAGGVGGAPEVVSDGEGKPYDTSEILDGVDMVVLVASAGGGIRSEDPPRSVAVIGRRCKARGITVAGVLIGEQSNAPREVLMELRRWSHMVLVSSGADDLGEILAALRV